MKTVKYPLVLFSKLYYDGCSFKGDRLLISTDVWDRVLFRIEAIVWNKADMLIELKREMRK